MSLVIEDLSFSYGKQNILDHISFRAEGGELLAVLGPNGAGKTTLFKCILGLKKGYTGTVSVDGTDVRQFSNRELAHRIASIPQIHPMSFQYSVMDMVLMGTSHMISPVSVPGKEQERIALEALDRLGISELSARPYDQLSGGEQQLVFIARALAQQAKILIMDEPTASLDYGNRTHVLSLIRKLADEGYTILMSTHDPQHALWYGTKALALSNGSVTAFGTPTEVLTEELLSGLYGKEIRLFDTPSGPVAVPGKEA